MSTAADLIQAAYGRARVYAPGQIMTAADSDLGLTQLNKLLDSLSNESLVCFATSEISFVLTPGKTAYTIGSSGSPDISATRPLRLLEGRGTAYSQDAEGNNYSIDVVPLTKWNTIGNRTSTSQSTNPSMIYYDPQYPLGIINVYPSPTIGNKVVVGAYAQLTEMANLTQVFSLPPGYELLIETSLALQLWPFFKSGDPPASMVRDAEKVKARVKRTNKRDDEAQLDTGLLTTPGYYDVYTDSYRAN